MGRCVGARGREIHDVAGVATDLKVSCGDERRDEATDPDGAEHVVNPCAGWHGC